MVPIIGAFGSDERPEPRRMIHFLQVGKFVNDEIIDDVKGSHDYPPTEIQVSSLRAASPA